jgi:predicted nucleic acid-binding protein
MSDKGFFDTNVLLYAHDTKDLAKQETARSLIAKELAGARMVLSTQVLSEYFVAATRKLGLAHSDAIDGVHRLSACEIVGVEVGHVIDAARISQDHQLSYWDALIVSTAAAAGCTLLYTEDLNDGQVIADVRVTNPFV